MIVLVLADVAYAGALLATLFAVASGIVVLMLVAGSLLSLANKTRKLGQHILILSAVLGLIAIMLLIVGLRFDAFE